MLKSKSQSMQAPLALIKQELSTPFQHQATYLQQHSKNGGSKLLYSGKLNKLSKANANKDVPRTTQLCMKQ